MFVGPLPRRDDSGIHASPSVVKETVPMPKREVVQDVRHHIARIEERSRQLLDAASTDARLCRSVEGLARGAATEAAAAGRLAASDSANVEAFLGQIGYNVQDQMRLLRHIENTHLTAATGPSSHSYPYPPRISGGVSGKDDINANASSSMRQLSIPAFLSAKRSALWSSLVAESQASLLQREEQVTLSVANLLWERRKSELAESLGLRNLRETTAAASSSNRAVPGGSNSAVETPLIFGRAAIPRSAADDGIAGYRGALPPPTSFVARRMATFARIVSAAPPAEWLTRFANAAVASVDVQKAPLAAPLASLWSTLHRVTSWCPTASTVASDTRTHLITVAASRSDLEWRAACSMFKEVYGAGAPLPDDFRQMHPVKFNELVARYTSARRAQGSTSGEEATSWIATFHAARCGRYDAAAVAAPDSSVASLFRFIADTTASKRHSVVYPESLNEHVQRAAALYREESTTKIPFRAAVLLLILAGDVGSDEAASKAVQQTVIHTASSLDDILWLRLTLVRRVRLTSPSGPALHVQALEEVQRQLLTDQQQLLVTLHGNTPVLIELLMHALLFNTAVRLLLDEPESFTDGIHMALCLHFRGLLTDSPAGTVETPLDVVPVLQRHVALLSRVDSVSDASDNMAAAAFRYFEAIGNRAAFVDLCVSAPDIIPLLFGRSSSAAASSGLGGVLLARHGPPPPRGLLDAAIDVARSLATNGASNVAIDVLLAVSQCADGMKEDGIVVSSLRHALRIMNQALSHRLLKALAGVSVVGLSELQPCSNSLKREVQLRLQQLPPSDVDAFDHLCTLAEVVSAYVSGDHHAMLNAFFSLSFAPSSLDAVDEAAHSFNAACVHDDVAVVVTRLLPIVSQVLLGVATSGAADILQARTAVESLCRWYLQWRTPGPADVLGQMRSILERFPNL